jgi:hypothetical protein
MCSREEYSKETDSVEDEVESVGRWVKEEEEEGRRRGREEGGGGGEGVGGGGGGGGEGGRLWSSNAGPTYSDRFHKQIGACWRRQAVRRTERGEDFLKTVMTDNETSKKVEAHMNGLGLWCLRKRGCGI